MKQDIDQIISILNDSGEDSGTVLGTSKSRKSKKDRGFDTGEFMKSNNMMSSESFKNTLEKFRRMINS